MSPINIYNGERPSLKMAVISCSTLKGEMKNVKDIDARPSSLSVVGTFHINSTCQILDSLDKRSVSNDQVRQQKVCLES